MSEKITETMTRVRHKGREVLLADYAGMRGEELVRQLQANEAAIVRMGKAGRRDLLILTDVSTATVGTEVLSAFKSVAAAMQPYTCASAVVGITAARKFLLQTVNLFSAVATKPLDTVEQAKDWLVEQRQAPR